MNAKQKIESKNIIKNKNNSNKNILNNSFNKKEKKLLFPVTKKNSAKKNKNNKFSQTVRK